MKRIFVLLVVFLFVPCFAFAEMDVHSTAQTNEETFYDEMTTKTLICDHFEEKGCKIKYVLFQPLVEKDDGIYGGMERWRITLETGEQIMAWFKNGNITYCYGGREFDEIPLGQLKRDAD